MWNSGTKKSQDLKYILAWASGIPWLINWRNKNRLLVLTYHGIYDGLRKPEILPATFVHVDDMVSQLSYIKRRYHIISPDDLLTFLELGSHLPKHAALITFDDGYESFYRLGDPVLRSLGIRALVFIPTLYVERHEPFWFDLMWFFIKYAGADKITWLSNALGLEYSKQHQSTFSTLCLSKMKRMPLKFRDEIMTEIKQLMSAESEKYSTSLRQFYPMSDKQLKKLSDQGTTFGGHTHTHTILSTLPDSLAEGEILENKNRLEALISRPCWFFAYPNGGLSDFNEKHKKILRRVEYKAAFSLTQRRSLIHEDPMDISRIHAAPEDTLRSLTFRCTGITPFINQLKAITPHPSLTITLAN